jgi:hypothetical protein
MIRQTDADGEQCTLSRDKGVQIQTERYNALIKLDGTSFLGWLPERSGKRPETLQCLPHSQLSQNPAKSVWEALHNRLWSTWDGIVPQPQRSLVSLPASQVR